MPSKKKGGRKKKTPPSADPVDRPPLKSKKRAKPAASRAPARERRRTRATNPASKWMPRFLEQLRLRGIIRHACIAAGVNRSTVRDRLEKDEVFAEKYAEALEDSADLAEEEAWRRAIEGVDKPHNLGEGAYIMVREYSDKLLSELLRARKPALYDRRKSQVEVSGPGGGPIQQQTEHTGEGDKFDADGFEDIFKRLFAGNGVAAPGGGGGEGGDGADPPKGSG